MKDLVPKVTLPSIDPDKLVGYVFAADHAGTTQRMKVKDKVDEETYLVEYADGNEDTLTYQDIINLLNKDEETGHSLWTFTTILNHRPATLNGKQTMEVEVLWDTGEKTWEPLNIIKGR